MPSVYQLKPAFQALLRPTVKALARLGVTPNQITLAAFVLSLAVGAVILWSPESDWPLLLLPAAVLLRMALNAMDGMLAREHNLATPAGALLNELGDVLSDSALYLPLASLEAFSGFLVVPIVVLAVIGELAGVLATTLGRSRRYDGPMGKSDRALVFGALGLAIGLGLPAGRWVTVVLALVLILSAVTLVHRWRRALAEEPA